MHLGTDGRTCDHYCDPLIIQCIEVHIIKLVNRW